MRSGTCLAIALLLCFACTKKNVSPKDTQSQEAANANVEATFKQALNQPEALLPDQDPVTIPADWRQKLQVYKTDLTAESWGEVEMTNLGAPDQKQVTVIPKTVQDANIVLEQGKDGAQKFTFGYTKFLFPTRTAQGLALQDLSDLIKGSTVKFELDKAGNVKSQKGLEELLARIHKKSSDPNLDDVVRMAFSEKNLKEYANMDSHTTLYGKTLKPSDEVKNRMERGPAVNEGKYLFQGWLKGAAGRTALFTYDGNITMTDGGNKVVMPTRAKLIYDPQTRRMIRITSITYMPMEITNETEIQGKKVALRMAQRIFMRMDLAGH